MPRSGTRRRSSKKAPAPCCGGGDPPRPFRRSHPSSRIHCRRRGRREESRSRRRTPPPEAVQAARTRLCTRVSGEGIHREGIQHQARRPPPGDALSLDAWKTHGSIEVTSSCCGSGSVAPGVSLFALPAAATPPSTRFRIGTTRELRRNGAGGAGGVLAGEGARRPVGVGVAATAAPAERLRDCNANVSDTAKAVRCACGRSTHRDASSALASGTLTADHRRVQGLNAGRHWRKLLRESNSGSGSKSSRRQRVLAKTRPTAGAPTTTLISTTASPRRPGQSGRRATPRAHRFVQSRSPEVLKSRRPLRRSDALHVAGPDRRDAATCEQRTRLRGQQPRPRKTEAFRW